MICMDWIGLKVKNISKTTVDRHLNLTHTNEETCAPYLLSICNLEKMRRMEIIG